MDFDGCCVYTQPPKPNTGGVALYVNNKLDHLERNHLGKLDDDFESIWTEIKNKKGKNFFVAVYTDIQILILPNLWNI